MSRNKKIGRNVLLLIVIIFILFPRYGIYLTPLSAHQASERSVHYGPSKVVHVEDFKGGKYFLGKYDKWVSCNTINRNLLFFWTFGNQVTGIENDLLKSINYTWDMTDEVRYKIYGIVNDEKIKKIEITLMDGRTFETSDFYDDMFLFAWEDKEDNSGYSLTHISVKAYDKDGNMILRENYPDY